VVRRDGGSLREVAASSPLRRVAAAYAVFIVSEYSVWIAVLVYAYARSGATAAGLVAVAQLVPAALVAPLPARAVTRRSPVTVLAVGYAVQGVTTGLTAVAMLAGRPGLAYAGAVAASAAVTTTRPAQAALVPALAATPDQLTAANVVIGWIEACAIAASGLLVGLVVTAGGPEAVVAGSAGLVLAAVLLVARLPAPALSPPSSRSRRGRAEDERSGTQGHGRARPLLALLTALGVVVGGLDLLFVLLAVDVLHRPAAWAGYLNLAYGAGAVASSSLAGLLVGRRLGGPVLASAIGLSLVLAALATGPGAAGTAAGLLVVGACRCVLDLAARTLLQRTVPAHQLGRVFGTVEGLTMAGLAGGALLVPALAGLGGPAPALLGLAAVLPIAAVVGGRDLLRLDAAARVPVVEIALLRSLHLFAELPAPAIEGLAAALKPLRLAPGDVLVREGEQGDAFYTVASGSLEVWRNGEPVRHCGRGEGVGEIALLRDVTRTATVRAAAETLVYQLDREPFLRAVTGHSPTLQRAGHVVDGRLLDDARRPASVRAPSSDP
jgi:hypothetical protein